MMVNEFGGTHTGFTCQHREYEGVLGFYGMQASWGCVCRLVLTLTLFSSVDAGPGRLVELIGAVWVLAVLDISGVCLPGRVRLEQSVML